MLAGYDDEVALLSDTGFEQLQTTRLANLERARHSGHPAYPLEGHMFTVAELDPAQLEAAVPRAIERAVAEMLEPPFGEFGGLPAIDRLAAEAGSWPRAVEDWQWCARFAYQVIERRGTGGGAFRLMYSRFLAEAGREEAPLAAAAAARWTRAGGGVPHRQRKRRAGGRSVATGGRRCQRCRRSGAAALDRARRIEGTDAPLPVAPADRQALGSNPDRKGMP